MPRLIILAVTLLSAFSLIAGPKATWLSDSHDFGAFDEDLSTCLLYTSDAADD